MVKKITIFVIILNFFKKLKFGVNVIKLRFLMLSSLIMILN